VFLPKKGECRPSLLKTVDRSWPPEGGVARGGNCWLVGHRRGPNLSRLKKEKVEGGKMQPREGKELKQVGDGGEECPIP